MASLWNKFKKRVGQSYDQVNILDGGKSYQNQNSNGPVGMDRIRDTFDANSKQDFANRNRDMGVPYKPNLTYAEEQKIKGVGRISDNAWQRTTNTGRSLAESIKEPYEYLGKGIATSIAYDSKDMKDARASEASLQDTYHQGIMKATKKLKDPTVSTAEKARWQKYLDQTRIDQQASYKTMQDRNQEVIDAVDPVKGAASVGSIGLDIVTLGVGTAGTQAVKQSGKVAAKQVGKQAAKEVFKKGMTQAEKEAAIALTKQTAKSAGRKAIVKTLAKQSAITGATNVPGGMVAPYISKGDDATWQDVAVGGATAFGTGAIIPNVAFGGSKVVGAGKDKIVKMLNNGTSDTKLKVNVADGLELETGTLKPKADTPSVYQTVNPVTGEKTFKVIKPDDFEQAKVDVDGKIAGTRRADGTVPHLTAKSPQEMQALGFREDGVYNPKVDGTIKVTQPTTPTVRVGSTQSMAELMPDLKSRQAQNINPADDIATRYGGKTADVQRNIDRYGVEATNNMYARKSDALPFNPETGQGIKNIDAVVSSELKKQYPDKATVKVTNQEAPTVKMSPEEEQALFNSAPPLRVDDAPAPKTVRVAPPETNPTVKVGNQTIDTVTGEIIEKPKTIVQKIKELPFSRKAKAEDMPNIEQTLTDVRDAFDQWGKAFTPEERATYAREVAEFSRTGRPVSPRTQEMYGVIKQTIDDMWGKSKRVAGKDQPEMGRYGMYMREQRAGYDGEPIEFGSSFIDSMNKEFGSAKTRTNAIPIDELDDPVNSYKNYAEQWFNDNYGHLKAAQNPAYSNFKDPVEYVKGNEDIVKKLAQKTDDEVGQKAGVSRSKAAKSGDILDDLQANYRANGGEEVITVDSKLPIGNSAKTHRQVLDDIGVYDVWGFHARDNADDIASRIFHENYQDIADLTPDQLYTRLKQDFGDRLPFDQQTNDHLIRVHQKRIMREVADGEPTSLPFQQLEKDLAGEQIKFFAERSNVTDNATKKYLNQRIERALSDNRRRVKLSEKISNEITSTLHAFYLGLKLPTAAQNLTETARTAGITDMKFWTQAGKETADPKFAKRVLLEAGEDKNFIKNQSNLPSNYKEGVMDKVRNASMFMFNATEGYKDAQMLRALQLQGQSKGLTGRELGEYVADVYNKHAFKGGEFGSVKGSDSVLGRPLWQFAQYPVKDIKLNASYFAKAITGNNVEQKQAISYLTKTFGAKAAMMAVTYPLFGWGLQQMFGMNPPKAGPITAIPQEIYAAIKDEETRSEEAGEEMNWQTVLDRVGRKYAGVAVPGGDYLFNKLGVGELLPDGKNPFSNDGAIAEWKKGYGENYKDNARIEGADDWFDYARQAYGGKYNTDAARGYFGNNPLTIDVDLPGDKLDVSLFKGENLRPLNKSEMAEFDTLGSKDEKNAYIKQKHAQTKTYQAYKKQFGDDLDLAIYGDSTKDPQTRRNNQSKLLAENPDLLAAATEIGKNSPMELKDPLFDLSPEKQKTFLQSEAQVDRSVEEKAIETNNPWIKDFSKKRGEYFAQFEKSDKPKVGLVAPVADETTKAKLTTMNELSDSGARRKYLLENPDVKDYFKQLNDYDRAYRKENKLELYDEFPEADGNVQKLIDQYTNAGPASSPNRKATERSAWIKAHPKEYEQISDYFNKVSLWTLQNEMALSKYEGIDPSEKGVKAIASLGKTLNSSGYGGYGGGGNTVSIRKGDWGEGSAAPTPTVSKPKGGTIKIAKRSTKKIKMVRNRA